MNLLYTLALTSVYIFNSQGQYLSVGEDGKPVLSKKTGCNGGNRCYRDSTERSRSQKL